MTPLTADLLVLFRRDLGAMAREVAPFPIAVAGVRPPTSRFLLHLAAHLAFHLGQLGYLRRALTGDPQHAAAMAIPDLAQP